MTAGELNLADLKLDQETFVALQRIQAEAAGSSDPHATPADLAKAAYQVAHGKLHKRIRPGGEDSDNNLGVDPDSLSEDKPPVPTDQASSAMSAAGLGDDATAEPSSSKPGRRAICSFPVKSRFASHKSSLTAALPISIPARSSRGRPRSRSQSVSSKRSTPASSPSSSVQTSSAASKALKDDHSPELVDNTSDVEISRSPEDSSQAIPSAEKDSRDPVPPPTCGKTISEAPAPTTEASPATTKIPDSGHQGSPSHKATLSAEQGDEDEDPPRSAQTSSLWLHAGLRAYHLLIVRHQTKTIRPMTRVPAILRSPSGRLCRLHLLVLPWKSVMTADVLVKTLEVILAEMSPRSTSIPVILLAKKLFLHQPRVQVQLVVLETFPRLHDLISPVTKALQLIPAIQVQTKER
ncbi:hypothetical protein PC123_g24044 [Phytophthora cactorum]|nr:hypothetical protein PC123_g24044 [Phytophthora cactorum]